MSADKIPQCVLKALSLNNQMDSIMCQREVKVSTVKTIFLREILNNAHYSKQEWMRYCLHLFFRNIRMLNKSLSGHFVRNQSLSDLTPFDLNTFFHTLTYMRDQTWAVCVEERPFRGQWHKKLTLIRPPPHLKIQIRSSKINMTIWFCDYGKANKQGYPQLQYVW